MIKINLQFFGGRGAGSDGGGELPMYEPPAGAGAPARPSNMDQQPGMADTTAEALGPQGKPMNVTTAVSGANPYHDLGPEYQFNCQRCIIATEARMRGYDVQALATYDNDMMPYGSNYLSNFNNPDLHLIRHTTANANRRDVEAQMASMGNGARAVMAFGWSGGGGHVINVVQSRGRTRYYDGQIGMEVSASHLFNAISRSGNIELTRVDNLSFSDTANQALRRHT